MVKQHPGLQQMGTLLRKWFVGYQTVSIPKLTQQQTFPDLPHREAVYGAVYYAVQAASNF